MMTHLSLPRLFTTGCCTSVEGPPKPSVPKLLLFYVVPLSLLPPLMYVYSQLVHPGAILPLVEPPARLAETVLVGTAFFLVELLAVAMMAMYIQQLGDKVGVHPSYAEAFTLAAIAPTPLWLATLGLVLPSLILNMAIMLAAWLFTVGLIRHGIQSLFMPYDDSRTHELANTLTFVGVMTWCGLLLFLVLLLSILLGWR